MRNRGVTLLLALAVFGAGFAFADEVDDMIAMVQKGVGEEVMLASVEQSKSTYNLSAAQIIKLKEGKVPDKVIAAMLRHRPAGGVAVAVAPKAEAPLPPPPPDRPAKAPIVREVPVAGHGILNVENLDNKTWAYRYEPDAQTLWITQPSPDGRGNIDAHSGMSLRMPTGVLKIRYNGQDAGPSVTIFADDKSLIMVSRVETAELEALYATVFEKGERQSSNRLVTLRENPAPRGNGNAKRAYLNDLKEPIGPVERNGDLPATATYVEPAPSYVYAGPVYTGGYYGYYAPYYYNYCGPRYYGGYCGPYYRPYYGGSFGLNYSNFGHHSGFGFHIGGRF